MSALFAPFDALVGLFEHPFFNESPLQSPNGSQSPLQSPLQSPAQSPNGLSTPKRLPADYALKHHIKTLKATYDNIIVNMNMALENIGYEDYDLNKRFARRAARGALKLFKFLVDPMSANLFMYMRGFQEHALKIAQIWTKDSLEAYDYLDPHIIYDVKTVAVLAMTAIELIPFVRHVE